MSILLQFRAIDRHNLTKRLLEQVTNCRITTVSCDRHARSYERVALSTTRSQFYHSFARSTRTILRKGCTQHHKIAILPQFRAIDTHDLTKGLHSAPQDRNFTTVSRDRHARSYERVALTRTRSQCYCSFVRLTRTILRKGCTQTHKIAILPQFRAIDTHDLTKGLHSAPQDRNFTTVSRDRHARSYERVALTSTRSQFYYNFARSTRTILRKGCTQHHKIAILLQFRAIDTHDPTKGLHFRKHFPDHGAPPHYSSKELK